MRGLLFVVLCFNVVGLCAQNQHDEHISALIKKYNVLLNLKCEILMKANVEGMNIPDKTILVEFKGDGKPKFIGKGLTLLPKKGMLNQFKELLSSPLQAIYLSKRKNNLVYKLVSLDQRSDWITADISFDENTLRIVEATIETKKHGAFQSAHTYNEGIYPTKSVITFNIKKFKIPLKFIGRSQSISDQPKVDENVLGKITLFYTYL